MSDTNDLAVACPTLDEAVAKARERFVKANPRSAEIHRRNTRVMPGGNTRTTLYYPPFPLTMQSGDGCRLTDADDHTYIDFLGDFTAGLFGHSEQRIQQAIIEALEDGLSLSAHNVLEGTLAELIVDRFSSIAQLRFTNSGTEANLMNLALATAFTGRSKILVFTGGYHGSVLTFSAGASPINVPHTFLYGTYNDVESATDLIRLHGNDLAAVLVEPMLGASGCIPATEAFLTSLRAESEKAGALLIFDEVMTSRLAHGGLQASLDIAPDLTTLGKYIGGGMSFGAFGGRAEIMKLLDPREVGALPHAGTFNNNVLTMAAGIVAMRDIFNEEATHRLNGGGDDLRDALNALCRKAGAPMQFTGLGSLMNMHPVEGTIVSMKDLAGAELGARDLFFYHLLERGIYIARRGFITLMLPVGRAERDAMVQATADFIESYADHLGRAV